MSPASTGGGVRHLISGEYNLPLGSGNALSLAKLNNGQALTEMAGILLKNN